MLVYLLARALVYGISKAYNFIVTAGNARGHFLAKS